MEPIKVFWVELLDVGTMSQHYQSDESIVCPLGKPGLMYHHARVVLPQEVTEEEWRNRDRTITWDQGLATNPKCACGYEFNKENAQSFASGFSRKWIDRATGKTYGHHDLPVGAMYDADWLHDHPQYTGADGISLHVIVPGNYPWQVDAEASNCTRKGDLTHKCWCRHGDPRTGDIHVDKVGNTCEAGAGSIVVPNWHGFLHHGYLRDC